MHVVSRQALQPAVAARPAKDGPIENMTAMSACLPSRVIRKFWANSYQGTILIPAALVTQGVIVSM